MIEQCHPQNWNGLINDDKHDQDRLEVKGNLFWSQLEGSLISLESKRYNPEIGIVYLSLQVTLNKSQTKPSRHAD